MAELSEKFSPIWIGVVELARERGVAGIVVMADRLLQPIDALPIERAPALERLGEAERLVVVDHERRPPAPTRCLHRAERGEILGERRIAEPAA